MNNPWRLVEWTNETGRTVKVMAFHESETDEVLNLPFPPGAVAREPVVYLTEFSSWEKYIWFRRQYCPFRPGDVFFENINQGDRPCKVLAVDERTGHFLYEYEMPGGRVFMRIDGRPVSEKKLSRRWKRLRDGYLD